jgi:hypothetical protein
MSLSEERLPAYVRHLLRVVDEAIRKIESGKYLKKIDDRELYRIEDAKGNVFYIEILLSPYDSDISSEMYLFCDFPPSSRRKLEEWGIKDNAPVITYRGYPHRVSTLRKHAYLAHEIGHWYFYAKVFGPLVSLYLNSPPRETRKKIEYLLTLLERKYFEPSEAHAFISSLEYLLACALTHCSKKFVANQIEKMLDECRKGKLEIHDDTPSAISFELAVRKLFDGFNPNNRFLQLLREFIERGSYTNDEILLAALELLEEERVKRLPSCKSEVEKEFKVLLEEIDKV